MKKLFLLISVLTLLYGETLAQKKPATPAPRPAPAPKGPPPYVLKKDYEVQLTELNAKIANAANAAAAVRRSMDGKFDKMIVLDSQMEEVQTILSSASFQIAMNADSLKETRFSMEEFQKKTDTNLETIKETQQSAEFNQWVLFGIAMGFSIIVLIVLLVMLKNKMAGIQTMLHKNEEILKKSLSLQGEKLQKELKDELHMSESRVLVDISALKRELNNQITKEKEATLTSLEALNNRLNSIENTGDNNNNSKDPEVFI